MVIGGGIAGAAVAFELARRGAPEIVLLEREVRTGTHASGRSAALILQNVADPVNCALARAGAVFYRDPPADLGLAPGFRPVGSLLLASSPAGRIRLERETEAVRGFGLPVALLSPAEAARQVPLLDAARLSGAAFCPTDGVVDVHSLLESLVRGAERLGVRVLREVRVAGIDRNGPEVRGVATTAGPIACRTVVNAAGAWAGGLGASAGAPLPLRPTRRHLVVTEAAPGIDPGWPFVWDHDASFYFRPEAGGLLICPCDVEDAPDCDEVVRPVRLAEAAAKAAMVIPSLGGLGVARAWAGIRTLTPDDRFVIGADPRLPGLFWVAGLGGHGISCAPAVGAVAADLLLTGRTDRIDARALAPDRFLSG